MLGTGALDGWQCTARMDVVKCGEAVVLDDVQHKPCMPCQHKHVCMHMHMQMNVHVHVHVHVHVLERARRSGRRYRLLLAAEPLVQSGDVELRSLRQSRRVTSRRSDTFVTLLLKLRLAA